MAKTSNGFADGERVNVLTSLDEKTGREWKAFVANHSSKKAADVLRLLITELIKRDSVEQQAIVDVVDLIVATRERVSDEKLNELRPMVATHNVEQGMAKRVYIRLTQSEYSAVKHFAEAGNTTITDWIVSYIRAGVTADALRPHPDTIAVQRLIIALQPIGINLNQITKKINKDPSFYKSVETTEIKKFVKILNQTLEELKKAHLLLSTRGRLLFQLAIKGSS